MLRSVLFCLSNKGNSPHLYHRTLLFLEMVLNNQIPNAKPPFPECLKYLHPLYEAFSQNYSQHIPLCLNKKDDSEYLQH